jgi:hypothetical protein
MWEVIFWFSVYSQQYERKPTEMVWAYDETSRNKCSKSCYENEHWKEKRKRKTKKDMVVYDWE